MTILIRTESPNDIEAIDQVTRAAFAGKSYSAGREPGIVAGLRETNALTLSLVAEVDGKVVCHAAFSPVTIDDKDVNWFGLGPVSVLPEFQRKGIGSMVIREGLTRLKELGAKGCVVEGNPNYYKLFGFISHPFLIYEEAPALEYFMVLSLDGLVPSGKVEYHNAFYE